MVVCLLVSTEVKERISMYLLIWSDGSRCEYSTLMKMADAYLAYGGKDVDAYHKVDGICYPLFWTLESVEFMMMK